MRKNGRCNTQPHQRVIAFLNRDQVDLLDRIGKDSLFSKGSKLSRARIIACLVDLMRELDINGKGISSLEELKERIKEKIITVWPTTREKLMNADRPLDKDK
jgi:hypothetical protein